MLVEVRLSRGCLTSSVFPGKRLPPGKDRLKKAYRNIPVAPADRLLLGMIWENQLFVDATLPFCLRAAPKIFTAVADAAEWMARQ